jgi:prepilin-type N-terminal cleavage/methylation domain-containing protein
MARRLRGPTPGFTILELLFALAIAGTLTTIAVPQRLRALDDSRTRAAARYVAQRLGDGRPMTESVTRVAPPTNGQLRA